MGRGFSVWDMPLSIEVTLACQHAKAEVSKEGPEDGWAISRMLTCRYCLSSSQRFSMAIWLCCVMTDSRSVPCVLKGGDG